MSWRTLISIVVLVGSAVMSAVDVIAGQAQPTASTQATYSPPRTPWGDPDLQGIWPSTDMVGVPFERPQQFGNRLFLTQDEFKAREAQAAKQQQLDVLDFDLEKPPAEIVALGDVGGVTSPPPHWLERGVPSRQSSLIVEPANGRMPPMTPEGTARQKTAGGTYTRQTGFNSASDLGPYDRCISRGVVGSMMPVVYNNGNQIIQTPGSVVFRNEMIHETRIIPLDPFDPSTLRQAQGRPEQSRGATTSGSSRAESRDDKLRVDGEPSRTVDGRPHIDSKIRSYMGDSRGHFEGNTLVVRTTNLNGKTGMQGNGMMLIPSDALELVERFTPVSADVLQYEVTINDPKTWTQPWKVSFPLKRDPDYQMFEYACHEGNHAMRNVLSASRADERK